MLDLLDYRRRVNDLYHAVRERGTADAAAHAQFVRTRDALFGSHSQSALDAAQKAAFRGLTYAPYNPAYRVVAAVDYAVEPVEYRFDLGDDGQSVVRQFGQVTVELPHGRGTLGLYWITGYGGGLFLPFRDTTNGTTTYGGGRYLFDTIKGADLGATAGELVLDFNYAYHPSCYYNPRWVCPLAPPQNRLNFPVEAGELLTAGID